jgi:hypothetical protein
MIGFVFKVGRINFEGKVDWNCFCLCEIHSNLKLEFVFFDFRRDFDIEIYYLTRFYINISKYKLLYFKINYGIINFKFTNTHLKMFFLIQFF